MELIDVDKRSVIERDVMTELMGQDRSGRARGYGAGVTKSQVTNLSYDLRRMRGENFTNQNQVGTLLGQVESQRKQLESQNKIIESQNTQIESQNKKIESQGKQIVGLHQTVDDFRNEFRLFQSVFQDTYDPCILGKKFTAPLVTPEDVNVTRVHELINLSYYFKDLHYSLLLFFFSICFRYLR